MRILWLVRHNLVEHPGGDTTQIIQTRRAVERLGITVEMTSETPRTWSEFDVVHLFHLDRLWEHLAVCRVLGTTAVPAVLSTIYWPADEFDRAGRCGLQGALSSGLGSERYQSMRQLQRFGLSAIGRRSGRGWDRRLFSFVGAARHLLENVAVVLPNSVAEQRAIERKFSVSRPAVIVPNAVDPQTFAIDEQRPWSERSGVLCVGRIEPRKNQLMLIRAAAGIQAPLTLVGSAGRFSGRYARKCRHEAGANVHFVEHQSSAGLRDLYVAARVHAAVSWYETPGLASLEAGLCGCNLLVTPSGSTREYFGEDADYCDPNDVDSIRAALESALSRPARGELPGRIAREFNWDAAGRATLRGYELALSG